ncbi:hypothetical protein RRG08_003894, partial [Elysia crispata]
ITREKKRVMSSMVLNVNSDIRTEINGISSTPVSNWTGQAPEMVLRDQKMSVTRSQTSTQEVNGRERSFLVAPKQERIDWLASVDLGFRTVFGFELR